MGCDDRKFSRATMRRARGGSQGAFVDVLGLALPAALSQTDRQTDRRTDRQTNRQIYREGDRDRDIEAFLRRCGEPTSICCRNNPGCAVASLCPLCR